MAVTMVITLFTSRLVLKALGFEDYGLYNVVGGVVTLFAFLKSSMSSSTQRFLSYEMGKGDTSNLRKVFSVCLTTHIIISLILLILAESIGLWFLNTQINIPEGREVAANWIYQFSVISLCISIVSVPYLADVISNEQMGYFAFLGILDAFLKLGIAYAVLYCNSDRLILYGFLRLGIVLVNFILNWIFCHRKFKETRYYFVWDKSLFKKVFSFSGWTIWGQLAIVGSNQGSNILVNVFHSVVANAAMGVGQQVNATLTGLVGNFQTAFKPQITKSYAAKDYEYLKRLTAFSSKISFFLLFLVSLPIMFNMNFILDIWLDKVPEFANSLCVIFIIASLCNAVSAPLMMNIFATGNIKKYQIAMSFIYILELAVVYAIFKCGASLVEGIAMKALLNFVVIFVRLYYTNKEVECFSIKYYTKNALFPIMGCVGIVLATLFLMSFFPQDGWSKILYTLILIIVSVITTYFVGMNKSERKQVIKLITNKIR